MLEHDEEPVSSPLRLCDTLKPVALTRPGCLAHGAVNLHALDGKRVDSGEQNAAVEEPVRAERQMQILFFIPPLNLSTSRPIIAHNAEF